MAECSQVRLLIFSSPCRNGELDGGTSTSR